MISLKAQLEKFRTQASPEQRAWLARGLMFTGGACLWRAAQTNWPTIELSYVGIVIFGALAFCYINILIHTPKLHAISKWSMPILAGGFLNFAVIISNEGFMPSASQETISGLHCPMAGANLVWLSDWIFGFVSPGDVLMIVGFLGVIITLALKHRQRELTEQV